jgi:hypothetical protein
MKLIKTLPIFASLLALCGNASAATILFEDQFNSDTSANYATGNNGDGSFTVSGGTLNISSAGNNTYSVFYNVGSLLGVGETASVDVTGLTAVADIRLTVSTAATGPYAGSNDGVRLKREKPANGSDFIVEAYTNGTRTQYFSSQTASPTFTFSLTRESENTFSAAFNGTPVVSDTFTTGQTVFTAGETTNTGDLFVGFEVYAGTANLDNFTITGIPEPSNFLLLGLSGFMMVLLRRRRA